MVAGGSLVFSSATVEPLLLQLNAVLFGGEKVSEFGNGKGESSGIIQMIISMIIIDRDL